MIRLFANAKINLTLDISGVREDGYHLMDMLNRSVTLCDILTVKKSEKKEHLLLLNGAEPPDPGKNLVMKAVVALEQRLGEKLRPLEFSLTKRIPFQSGMGGGSADAAAALRGVSEILNLRLTEQELQSAALQVGADVPFCLRGGCARVKGIGEVIRPVPDNCKYFLAILMPQTGKSTAQAFREADARVLARPDTDSAQECLAKGDLKGLAKNLGNAFYDKDHDGVTSSLIRRLIRGGALGASLTGSGAAVFGLFSDRRTAERCVRDCRRAGIRAWSCEPAGTGVFAG